MMVVQVAGQACDVEEGCGREVRGDEREREPTLG